MNVAIIGAGISGVNLYKNLQDNDNDIVIFEKSRGVGGRCSTRYVNNQFIDHGTPFFKADDKSFISFCTEMISREVLIKNGDYYYPKYGINKLCHSIINEENLIKNTKITKCVHLNNKWVLTDENGITYRDFDKLFITIPTPQVLELDIILPMNIKDKLKTVRYDSIATLLVYSYTLQNLIFSKFINNKNFKRIIDNSNKYKYDNFSSYVIHLNETITNQQNFTNKEEVKKYMLKKVYSVSGIKLEDEFQVVPHLWKYALVSKSIEESFLYDENRSLGFCGDYFGGATLQSAYLSSMRLYEQKLK